jgi:addiction module HigA family antidote
MSIARTALKDVDFGELVTGRRLATVHPGVVLASDFIEPMGLTRYKVARAIGVQQRRIDEICAGARSVTADTAILLGHLFRMEPEFWLRLQAQHDIEVAQRTKGTALAGQVHPDYIER